MNNYEIDELVNRMYSIVNNEIKNNIKYKKSIFIKLINKLSTDIDNHLVSEILDNLVSDIDKHLVKDIDNNSLVTYIAESNYNIFLNINKQFVRTFEKHRLRRSEKRRVRKFEKLQLRTRNSVNLFDIDIKFIKQCYNLHNYTNEDIVSYVKNNNYINYIFHPKQLYNLFNDKIKLLVNKNNCIQVEYENNYYDLNNFVNYIETFSYNTLKNICIKEIVNNNFTENKLLILVYIGSEITINTIIENLKMYSNIENFSLSFCINYKLIDKIVPLIKEHFTTNYIIYSSNEFGNDITPSLLMYDDIINKYNFDYILKIHTKSDKPFLYKAMNYLFNENLQDLLLRQNANSSSIGFMYVKNTYDDYNKILNTKYSYLLKNNEFVPGTIFLTQKCVMDKVLQFFIDNYKIIFYQNMYDDNTLNKDCSYVHFMERLFGYI
jgi:hypothetical protein